MVMRKLCLLFLWIFAAPAFAEAIDVIGIGNDAGAKAIVARFVEAMGLVPFDRGSIEVAHWTEYAAAVEREPDLITFCAPGISSADPTAIERNQLSQLTV